MLTVNIWYSTALWKNKRVKHGIFGPYLAARQEDQNVGHVNLQISVDESAESFAQIDKNIHGLPLEATLSTVPVTVNKGDRRHYEQKKVRMDLVSHSFWPAKDNTVHYVKEVLHLLHLGKGSKGVPSLLATHSYDMRREEIGKNPLVIQHPHPEVDLQKDEQALKELDIEITLLRVSLSNRETMQKRFVQFKTEKDSQLSQQRQLAADYQMAQNDIKKDIAKTNHELDEASAKLKFNTKKLNYLEKLPSHSDSTPEIKKLRLKISQLQDKQKQLSKELDDLHAALEQKRIQYQTASLALETDLKTTLAALSFYENTLAELEKKINGRDQAALQRLEKDYATRKDMLQRSKTYLENLHSTTGRHADRTIHLPTSDSGLPYYIDELAVIEAMAQEKAQNYTFITNNCARSAKRCLLAGVKHLQEPFIEAGVSPTFFQLKGLETCTSIRAWVRDLEAMLVKLNYAPLPKEPVGQPKI